MVLQRFQTTLALCSILLATTSAFSAQNAPQLVRSPSTCSSSAIFVGAVWGDENDAYMMNRAIACGEGSETCSLEEAQSYLHDILLTQKDCQSLSIESPLCENVDVISGVVANLRQKITIKRTQMAPIQATAHMANLAVGFYVVSTILHGFAAVPNVPVDAPMFTSFDAYSEGAINNRGIASILPVEWYWAIRDGYFPSLVSEWIRNGGLVVDVSAFDEKVVAFTPQEWAWSIQNGSFGHIMEENMRFGGYHVDSTFDNDGTTSMNAQDLLWSIQGGYFGTAVNHFFRNGGV